MKAINVQASHLSGSDITSNNSPTERARELIEPCVNMRKVF